MWSQGEAGGLKLKALAIWSTAEGQLGAGLTGGRWILSWKPTHRELVGSSSDVSFGALLAGLMLG